MKMNGKVAMGRFSVEIELENYDDISAADLTSQFGQVRLMVPRRLTDELLQRLPILIVKVSDRLRVFAFDVRDQARHILMQMRAFFGRRQQRRDLSNSSKRAANRRSIDVSFRGIPFPQRTAYKKT